MLRGGGAVNFWDTEAVRRQEASAKPDRPAARVCIQPLGRTQELSFAQRLQDTFMGNASTPK